MNAIPSPANEIVAKFVNEICSIHSDFIIGIYLTGSIPLNDFYSNKSDIDFLVFCKDLPDKKTASQLKDIHLTIGKHHPKPDLSGSYLSIDSIQTDNPENINVLSWHEGSMRYGKFEMATISLSELKSNAVTVYGQIAESLNISIKQDYLNKFLFDNINSYWVKWLKQHSSLIKKKILLLLFPRFTEWSVLGVARQLCTLQTGKIVSKTEAGYYCLEYLPVKYHSIIKEAIKIRKDNKTYPFVKTYAIKPSISRLSQTIECVNYIITTINNIYKAQL